MISGFDSKYENSNYYIYKWARGLRADYHVARCSNHAVGAHGNINYSISQRGTSNFSTGLSAIINYVLKFFQNRKNNHGCSFAKHHIKIKQKMIKLLRPPREFNIKDCAKNCSCSDNSYNELIFGVKYQCCHKILEQIYVSQQMANINVILFCCKILVMSVTRWAFSPSNINKACKLLPIFNLSSLIYGIIIFSIQDLIDSAFM